MKRLVMVMVMVFAILMIGCASEPEPTPIPPTPIDPTVVAQAWVAEQLDELSKAIVQAAVDEVGIESDLLQKATTTLLEDKMRDAISWSYRKSGQGTAAVIATATATFEFDGSGLSGELDAKVPILLTVEDDQVSSYELILADAEISLDVDDIGEKLKSKLDNLLGK